MELIRTILVVLCCIGLMLSMASFGKGRNEPERIAPTTTNQAIEKFNPDKYKVIYSFEEPDGDIIVIYGRR